MTTGGGWGIPREIPLPDREGAGFRDDAFICTASDGGACLGPWSCVVPTLLR